MEAKDYPVRTPYGYTGAPYSPQIPHKGNDRKTPVGTPVDIEGITIGITGNTGSYNGQTYEPHLHTQAGTDPACQNTVDPSPFEFLPGTVTATGTGPQWGQFVTIKTGNRYVTYAHLSEIKVKVGQVIAKGVDVITRGRAIRLLRVARREITEAKIDALMKQDEDVWLDAVYDAPWFKAQTARINTPITPAVPLKPGTYQVK